MNYIHEVNIDRSPHFLGPGLSSLWAIVGAILYFMGIVNPKYFVRNM